VAIRIADEEMRGDMWLEETGVSVVLMEPELGAAVDGPSVGANVEGRVVTVSRICEVPDDEACSSL